ncbi:MAG: glycosyltransferase [Chitinivibrionales bacterium]|nr:glycosyltransferase [Chitinivibrionales bacterium]
MHYHADRFQKGNNYSESGVVPEMSVIIPTYRRKRQVTELIDRLLSDFPEKCELIIVQQDENTLDVSDKRVKLLVQKEPSLPRARNRGIHASKGKVVLFFDDDCVPSAGCVSRHMELHECFPRYSVIAGQVRDANNRGTRERVVEFDPATLTYICDYALCRDEEITGFPGGHASIKRSAFRSVLFDSWFRGNAHFEEIDFALRLKRKGGKIFFTSSMHIDHFLEKTGGCRSEKSSAEFYFNQFYNRALCFAKNVSLKAVAGFLNKQKYDLEYFSRKRNSHSKSIVAAGLTGLATGLSAGTVRRNVGPITMK